MFDAYLEIEEVGGDSVSQGFEGQFEIISYEHEVVQPMAESRSMSGSGATGRAKHGTFLIHKRVDKASPWLAEMCSSGLKRTFAHLRLVRATGTEIAAATTEKNVFMEYLMKGIQISSIKHHAGKDSEPLEVLGITYDSIEWTWTSADGKNVGSWNLVTNEAKV